VASHYPPKLYIVGETPPADYVAPPYVHPITPFHMALATRDEEMLEAYSDDEEGVSRFFRETKARIYRNAFNATEVAVMMVVAVFLGIALAVQL
jgi:hypothetical protein